MPETRTRPEEGAGWRLAVPLILLAALLLRAPGFTASVLDPDEGLYLLQAAAWLQGGWPFVAVWDMHPPGAPALIALVHAAVPDPLLALRLAGALAVAATGCGLYAVARRLGAGPATGLAAGLLYVAQTVVLGGLATNTEILFAPFVVLAAWLLLGEARREAGPRRLAVLAAGLAAGSALLVKQVAALEASVLWLGMVVAALAARRIGATQVAVLAALFALGAGLPTLLVAAGYALAGHFDLWWQGNIGAPLSYVDAPGLAPGFRRGVFAALPHLVWPGLAALGLPAAPAGTRRALRPVLAWLGGALLAVALPGKFYDHYFLIAMPALCLLAAFGLAALARAVLLPDRVRVGFAVAVALLMAMPAMEMLLPRLAQGAGLRAPDAARQVGAQARALLRPGEALYVANWHPIAYVLAGQLPPTRYAFPGHLAGLFAPVTGVDADAELARVLALPPGVIVLSPAFWTHIRPAARNAVEQALAAGYALAATVPDGSGAVEVWRRQ